jgi:hypothetical protein
VPNSSTEAESVGARPLDGNEWQVRVERWLRLRYGTEYQSIPAADGGDRALEGYSRDGNVYQCYGARDGYDVRSLYEHQRDKLTADISHFITYRTRLLELFPSGFLVRRYVFIVPKFESAQLVAHANRKAEEVKAANLPYVHAEFGVSIWSRENFEIERKQEEVSFLVKLPIEFREPSSQEITNWTSENDQGVRNLEWKLPLCTSVRTPERLRKLRDEWIRAYILSANALARLRSYSTAIWEKLNKSRLQKERRLALSYENDSGPAAAVKDAANELAEAMRKSVGTLDHDDAGQLADGIVADWLQKCSLLPQEDYANGITA